VLSRILDSDPPVFMGLYLSECLGLLVFVDLLVG
jgi:hypothetical protein